MPGALDVTGRRFIQHADCGEADWLWVAEDGCERLPVAGRLPDLADPATRGCLLALVREAWGDPMPMVDTLGAGPYWSVWSGHVCRARGCATEAEALVVALEAAPQKGIGSSPAPGPPP